MAKAIVYDREESGGYTCEGEITVSLSILRDGVETNQPVIAIEKAGTENLSIELSWPEAMKLWDHLTGLVGREIIKGRVEDILYGKDTCHYCGAPYNAEERK